MTPLPRTPPLVTVSIVSHGQIDLILPLLHQLDKFSHAQIAELVLIHNIPENPEENNLELKFPVRTIVNSHARGFGENHNAAFKYCRSPWFLVLNPDVRLDGDVLAPLIAQAAGNTAILSPRVQEPEKSQLESHRRLVTPWELITRRRGGYRAPPVPEWVPGLFMLIRSNAYAAVGGFDERFFMYGEDVDLCVRLGLADGKIQIDETRTIRHEARRDSHASRQHLYWHLRSLARLWLSASFWRCSFKLNRHRAG